MSESLVLKIITNFDTEFTLFKSKAPNSLIKTYFKQKGVSNIKHFLYKRTKHQLIGQTKQRKADGYCLIRYSKDDFYIGKVRNNKKHGKGYHHFPNGLVFKGTYSNGKKTAGIVFELKTKKLIYEGGWKNDRYHGWGRLARPSGETYEGSFEKGKFHGNGVLTWPNGTKYEGGFVNGKRQGKGILLSSKGHIYEGGFKGGRFEGEGVYRWGNMDEYKGEFKEGGIGGSGVMSYRELGISGSGVWESLKNISSVVFDLEVGTNRELFG